MNSGYCSRYKENKIGKEGTEILCEGISKLKKLTRLNLQLGFSYIENEGAVKLGEAISKLQNLKNLNLNLQHSIGQEGPALLRKEIWKLQNLKNLYLNLNTGEFYLNQQFGSAAEKLGEGVS